MTPEWRVALSLSVGFHAGALIGWPAANPAAFDVERAPTSLELYIVAPPTRTPETHPTLEPQPQPMAPVLEESIAEQMVVSSEQRGARVEELPTYLRNPAPVYPEAARRLGYEGRVVLEVEVLPSGRCGPLRVLESSGHELLDRAATSAVRGWVFRPARRWGEPVAFQVEIPITFRLLDGDGVAVSAH